MDVERARAVVYAVGATREVSDSPAEVPLPRLDSPPHRAAGCPPLRHGVGAQVQLPAVRLAQLRVPSIRCRDAGKHARLAELQRGGRRAESMEPGGLHAGVSMSERMGVST